MNETIEIQDTECIGKQVKPWWRRNFVLLIVGMLVLAVSGVAIALALTMSHGAKTASSIIQHDGYAVTMVLNQGQLATLGSSSDPSTSGLISTLFDSGAIGTNGGKAEAVLHLTTSGKTFFSNPVIISAFATGVGQGVSMHQDGDFLVMSGPMNSFGSGN